MIKVSIIVPIYNVANYIIRCLDSVINQTYSNIECILVDDCSPDNSMALVEQRLKSYTGTIEFKILHHEQNRGLSAARNTGTKISTGDYIYYLDSDDEIFPECIKELVALVKKYQGLEMIQGNTQTIPKPSKKSDWRNISYKNFPEYVNDNNWVRQHFYNTKMKHIPVNAWNKLIKRNFIFEHNCFFKEGVIHEDELWMFFIVKKLCKVAFSISYSYIHYENPGSIMLSGDNKNSIKSWSIILNKIYNSIDYPLYKHQKKKYIWVLYYNMQRMDLDIKKEKELYFLYKSSIKSLLIKDRQNIFFSFALILLLTPQFFYKSFIGYVLFRLLVNIYIYR
jgi:glycosyltransferase involved in cell wall biosynthesis